MAPMDAPVKTHGATRPVLRIVILAAGFSRRLGKAKAFERVRGLALVRRTAATLASLGASRLIVVVPPRHGRFATVLRGLDVDLLPNALASRGLSSSVQLGLRHARDASAVLFVPMDLVDLSRRDLGRLIARWRASPRKLVARRIGAAAGTPLILPRRLFPVVARIEGDVGLRDVVRAMPPMACRLLALPSAAADVDEPRDLHAARRRLRGLALNEVS